MKLVLSLLGFLLLEKDLILVIYLSLCKTLIALFTHIVKPLLEAHLLRIVELFQLSKLLLRVLINLVDCGL